MPSSFNPNVVEVVMKYLWNSQNVLNTLWFRTLSGTPPTIAQISGLCNAIHSWYEAELIPLQGSNCSLVEIYARQAVEAGGIEFTLPAEANDDGTMTGDPEAGNVTLVVSFRTGLSGRSYRGRNYSVGMTKEQQTGGTATVTYRNDLQLAYAALPGYLEDANAFTWVVYSQFSGVNPTTGDPIPRATGLATPITAVVVTDDRTDSQRRRLRARGA